MKAPLSLFVIPSATIMGLRPTQGNEKLFRLVLLLVPNRSVIPTGAKRSGGTCCSSSAVSNLNGSATLPFVIPTEASEVEGSAVPRTTLGNVFRQSPARHCISGLWRRRFPEPHWRVSQYRTSPEGASKSQCLRRKVRRGAR